MVRIIIDDVEDVEDVVDLLNALAAVQSAFTDPDAYEYEVRTFSKAHGATGCGDRGAAAVRPVPLPRHAPAADRLLDGWCAVHRGACLSTDVLHPDAWDIALVELLPADGESEE